MEKTASRQQAQIQVDIGGLQGATFGTLDYRPLPVSGVGGKGALAVDNMYMFDYPWENAKHFGS